MLRISTFISFAIPLLFVQACAQSTPFVSSEGGFSIDLRATPSEDKNSAEAKTGGKKLWWRTEHATFMVSYAVNPDAKREYAERAVVAAADGYSSAIPKAAEILSRKNIVLGGYPGVEITSREKDSYTVVARYFMVDTRLYCIMALWSAGSNDKDVLRTLDSFKISAPSIQVTVCSPNRHRNLAVGRI
jgi:hypothetical protein